MKSVVPVTVEMKPEIFKDLVRKKGSFESFYTGVGSIRDLRFATQRTIILDVEYHEEITVHDLGQILQKEMDNFTSVL